MPGFFLSVTTQQKITFLFEEKKTYLKKKFLEIRHFEHGRIARYIFQPRKRTEKYFLK